MRARAHCTRPRTARPRPRAPPIHPPTRPRTHAAQDLKAHKHEVWGIAAEDEDHARAKGPYALALRLEALLNDAPDAADPDVAITYGQLQLLDVLLGYDEGRPGCVAALSPALGAFLAAARARPRVAAYLASTLRFPPTCNELGVEGGYDFAQGRLTRGQLVA